MQTYQEEQGTLEIHQAFQSGGVNCELIVFPSEERTIAWWALPDGTLLAWASVGEA